MADERRRQKRVQGSGWSPNSRTGPAQRKTDTEPLKSDGKKSSPVSAAYPAWTTKNIDCTKDKGAYVFQSPVEEDVRRTPPHRMIDEAGVYDLSKTESGLSRLRFFPSLLTKEQADTVFSTLITELHWKQKTNRRRGVAYVEPRLTSWFGDVAYQYSGVTQEPNPNWTPTLLTVKNKVEDLTGLRFNSMLANLYRDCKDSVDWHADNEPALGKNPVIASVSLGETRNFELRQNPDGDDCTEDGVRDYTYVQHVRIPLTHGSLLLMEGATQHDWQHRVPKEYHDRGPRINLTFRTIYNE